VRIGLRESPLPEGTSISDRHRTSPQGTIPPDAETSRHESNTIRWDSVEHCPGQTAASGAGNPRPLETLLTSHELWIGAKRLVCEGDRPVCGERFARNCHSDGFAYFSIRRRMKLSAKMQRKHLKKMSALSRGHHRRATTTSDTSGVEGLRISARNPA